MSNLANFTKLQLIADNPRLDLKMSMTKDQMIAKIETTTKPPKTAKTNRKGEY
jgi:hypothetical protein